MNSISHIKDTGVGLLESYSDYLGYKAQEKAAKYGAYLFMHALLASFALLATVFLYLCLAFMLANWLGSNVYGFGSILCLVAFKIILTYSFRERITAFFKNYFLSLGNDDNRNANVSQAAKSFYKEKHRVELEMVGKRHELETSLSSLVPQREISLLHSLMPNSNGQANGNRFQKIVMDSLIAIGKAKSVYREVQSVVHSPSDEA